MVTYSASCATLTSTPLDHWEDNIMAWTKPTATSIACGMEINMYGPSEDEDHDLF